MEIPILPVCHSGQTKSALPEPLSRFQALDLHEDDFCKDLIKGFAGHLGVSRTPRIDYDQMTEDLTHALDSIEYDPTQAIAKPLGDSQGKDMYEIRLIKELAEYGERGVESMVFAKALDETVAKVRHTLERLREQKLVSTTKTHPPNYFVTPAGLQVLVEGGHI